MKLLTMEAADEMTQPITTSTNQLNSHRSEQSNTRKMSHSDTSVKKIYMSNEQKEKLLKFVAAHPRISQKMWREIAMRLNRLKGATKQWDDWRKSYSYLKSLMKARAQKIGGSPRTVANNFSLPAMEETVINGNPHVSEIPTNSIFVKEEVTESQASSSRTSDFYDEEFFEISKEFGHGQAATPTRHSYEETEKQQESVQSSTSPKRSHTCPTRDIRRSDDPLENGTQIPNPSDRDIDMRESYYERKLQIMDEANRLSAQDIIVKNRIASALENLLKKLEA